MSKKIIVKLDVHDGRDKQRAMKAVAALVGVDAISVDLASQKMTVIGMVDPVKVVSKLRKASCSASIVSIGPANPPPEKKEEKKEEKKDEKKEGEGEKKDEKKEGEGEKKDEKKDGEGEKKDEKKEEKKPAPKTEQQIIAELLNQYRAYHPYPYMAQPPPPPPHYYVHSMEENPNSCAIC